ncbi:MAG: hypothetical protein V3V19_11130 [Cocleimonas sp.]
MKLPKIKLEKELKNHNDLIVNIEIINIKKAYSNYKINKMLHYKKEMKYQMEPKKTKEREELEKMYEQGDCMLDCAMCLEAPRPSIAEPYCKDCRKRIGEPI